MLNTSFPPWPCYTNDEAEAIKKVLLSNKVNYWTGEETKKFEKMFAESMGVSHSIAVSNGTMALDLALIALGISSGDEVIVTPRTFIASTSSIVTAGATPIFADIDRDSQNITATTIERVLTNKTKAIIVVHLAGMPADMDPIMDLASRHGLFVIEDCAQAHGGCYKGRSVGSIGHIGAWSFCQDKIISTGGEGGMVTTNDSELWNTMWSFKDHGKSWDAIYNREHQPGFRWLHESFGTNMRMTEIQGIIGQIQLAKLPEWQNVRLRNAEKIWAACREIPWLRVPKFSTHFLHAAYKAYVFVDNEKLPLSWNRDRILNCLLDQGIPAYSGSCSEVYMEKAFEQGGFRPKERLPVAKELGETSLMFLVHPTLHDAHLQQTIDAIKTTDKLIQSTLKNLPRASLTVSAANYS